MQYTLECGRFRLPLDRPLVMGILNVTPDSFSDGGRFNAPERAMAHAAQMIADGVDIIDIGGESTRPGSAAQPLDEELRRILPVLQALRDCGKPLSIDTCKPEVMRAALAAGADMINDINGFMADGAVDAVRNGNSGLCIMHMQGDPRTMQAAPRYGDVVAEVAAFLRERRDALEAAGVARTRLCIDPGFGFGKTLAHNLELLKHIGSMQAQLDLPVLAGLSRKSMLGAITGKPVQERLAGSVAAAIAAVARGARIVRVHDVAETVDALKIWQAVNQNNS
ncbi:MAG: Dihydropteroate synthase [Herminiimonas sp.]|nr:Dihydropteroate synthase [Herminiimonas sp.]